MLIDKVKAAIKKYEMLNYNDKIIVGVSGGPDSMCLLHVLLKIKNEYNLKLIAAHVNHCLRGEEADSDEKYVETFCKQNNIEFYSQKIDINKLAEDMHISCEEAGRHARYEFFNSLLSKTCAQKIALAHNANDNAETILMHFFRGSGLDGLYGIKPVRDNIYIRPIINIKRSEIEEYCTYNNINPRIDRTNLEGIYSRNKIRLKLIPYIEENFNKNIIDTAIRNSELIKIDNDFIESIVFEKYKNYIKKEKNKVIILKDAFCEHEAVLTRLIRKALYDIKGDIRNIEKIHVNDIINVQMGETGKGINLPSGISVYNDYKNIVILRSKLDNKSSKEYKLKLGYNIIPEIQLKILLEIVDNNNIDIYTKNNNIRYFKFDNIKTVILRYRKNGDKYIPYGMKKYKKLKDEFIDLKISRNLRGSIPLICFDDEIAWITGYKTSENFKITKDTDKILRITVKGEDL